MIDSDFPMILLRINKSTYQIIYIKKSNIIKLNAVVRNTNQ